MRASSHEKASLTKSFDSRVRTTPKRSTYKKKHKQYTRQNI